MNGQRPALIWMTGLSGSGKSTIANLVEKKLYAMGRRSYLLDGDNVRPGFPRPDLVRRASGEARVVR